MSYSRWSTSCWYTYSDVNLINDEATFTICDEGSYAITELIENRQSILDHFRNKKFERVPRSYKKGLKDKKNPFVEGYTEEEIQELSGYMNQFIEDYITPELKKKIDFKKEIKKIIDEIGNE